MKHIGILGVTGSIGENALAVLRAMPGRFSLDMIAAGSNWKLLAQIAKEFSPKVVAVSDPDAVAPLREALAGQGCAVLAGVEGVCEACAMPELDMLLSAAVGESGLLPTLAAIDAGTDIALANKESLVMAGEIVMGRARERGVTILPVDSEHSALFQCLQAGKASEVARLTLTASGGAFRGRKRHELEGMTAADALKHPTWDMGPKVTIDSAGLVNKALEVIEAHWLFDVEYDRIGVVIHPQSAVHSMVDFVDGSTIAQISGTTMQLPIQYALTWPDRCAGSVARLDLAKLGSLTFEEPDHDAFPCLNLGFRAGREGGLMPTVYSSANEEAVMAFLRGTIRFLDIPVLIEDAMDHMPKELPMTLDSILQTGQWARRRVAERIAALSLV